MTDTKSDRPFYTGLVQHRDEQAGFSLWLPSTWYKFDLQEGHVGVLYSPYADDINTCFLAEKHELPVKVKEDDMDTLREGFMEAIKALPGVEILSTDEHISPKMISFFEARYTFLEGDVRRKRWVKNIYWGRAQLVLLAQGRTLEDFDYWLPMFYNTMMTANMA